MKKLLFGILTFLGIGLSFCSAGEITLPGQTFTSIDNWGYSFIAMYSVPSFGYNSSSMISASCSFENLSVSGPGDYEIHIFGLNGDGNFTDFGTSPVADYLGLRSMIACGILTKTAGTYSISFDSITFISDSIVDLGSSSSSNITVYYNSGSSTDITCDGVQAIQINGLSTITSTNTFTPYYNISYTDEDNQKLTESYSKSNLYLSGGLFKKTYTGDNERILTDTIESPNSSFSGYVPVFDVTGSTQPIDTEYNMFNNFTDNSLKVLLSNIPSFFQYVVIFSIILMIIGIVKVFKRKK